jgi:3-dehydroquinate dehydratase / shikimate dehydrogenase
LSLICTSIMVADEPSAWRQTDLARQAGADLVEYRIDESFSGSGEEAEIGRVVRLVAESPLPCIVTCRPTAEGGHYDGPDDARIALFERLGTAFGKGERPPRFIDVELSTLVRSANIRQKIKLAVEHPEQVRDLSTSLILSLHDFQGRPSDLSRRLLALQAEPAAKVLKIAYRARSLRDNLDLFELLQHRDRPMIALGMGEFGLMSRVLAPKFGGFLTFASLRPETATAPGQPTIAELLSLYRFRSIGARTAVYGVVGWPVGHSLSPRVHNAGFGATGHDGVYLPLPTPAGYESLKATLLELLHFPGLHLGGLSITLPHKENLVRLARELGWGIDETAQEMGAANTLVADDDGVRIFNTDVVGLMAALGGEQALAGRQVVIVGAGGVGRAAAYGAASAGAEVSIINRTHARAEAMASELTRLNLKGSLRATEVAMGDVLINCTPAGMRGGPAPDQVPVSLDHMPPHAVVMDTVYTPEHTPLLAAAAERGLSAISGVSMFVEQAAAQFSAWTGRKAPRDLFGQVVREAAE